MTVCKQALLQLNPYHIDSLLQLSDVCRIQEDQETARDLIGERDASFKKRKGNHSCYCYLLFTFHIPAWILNSIISFGSRLLSDESIQLNYHTVDNYIMQFSQNLINAELQICTKIFIQCDFSSFLERKLQNTSIPF